MRKPVAVELNVHGDVIVMSFDRPITELPLTTQEAAEMARAMAEMVKGIVQRGGIIQ